MANWYGASRTNYFEVTDEQRYQELFNRLKGTESEIEDFTEIVQGKTLHGFGSYGDIYYQIQGDNDSYEVGMVGFAQWISEILTPKSVFVYTCVGNEKLRYLTGSCIMAFPNGRIMINDVNEFAQRAAKQFFGNDYELNLYY